MSLITLQDVVDDSLRFGEIKPVLSVGGSSLQPALTIANEVMNDMLSPRFNFKWNRANATPFYTNSWQQDYANSISNMGWVEGAWSIDINNTSYPKPKYIMEAVRDLQPTSISRAIPFQIAFLPNRLMLFGTWGANDVPNQNNTGQANPGPNAVYTNPLGITTNPNNPITQIQDTNGNLLVLTTFGTCDSVEPTWPAADSPAGTTVTDGTVVWTVVDPDAVGFRVNPAAASASVLYQINPVYQKKPVRFTSFSQTLAPIPDDFATYFFQGFRAKCYQRSPEEKVRGKFASEYALWQKALADEVKQDDREQDSYGFIPGSSIVAGGTYNPSPAWPYGWQGIPGPSYNGF